MYIHITIGLIGHLDWEVMGFLGVGVKKDSLLIHRGSRCVLFGNWSSRQKTIGWDSGPGAEDPQSPKGLEALTRPIC